MIPAQIAVLDALPLTANGKIDRAALSEVEADGAADPDAVEPRTETERQIARIWTDLLPVSAVGIHDNFFALGGHSLLATRVASRLRDALGIEVTIRMIFEAPTIAELAQVVDGSAAVPVAGTGPTLERLDRSRFRVERSEATPGRAV
jgi:aryl carrier-like protein